jgi:hypothetical protein
MKARKLLSSLAAGSSYGPDQLKAIGLAFDAAWLEIAPDVSNRPEAIEAARLKLARTVLNLARQGIIEPDRLKAEALDMMLVRPARL